MRPIKRLRNGENRPFESLSRFTPIEQLTNCCRSSRGSLRIDLTGRKVGLGVGWSRGHGGVGHALHRGWHALQKRLKRLKRPTVTCVSGPQRKKRNPGARNATQISAARFQFRGCWGAAARGLHGAGQHGRAPPVCHPVRLAVGRFGPIFGRFSAIFLHFRHFLPVGVAPCVARVAP